MGGGGGTKVLPTKVKTAINEDAVKTYQQYLQPGDDFDMEEGFYEKQPRGPCTMMT